MTEAFLVLLIGALKYQLIGVALLLPLELLFPRVRMSFADRTQGLLFLIAPTPLVALLAALGETFRPAPLVMLHSGFGAPILASVALALWVDLQFYALHRFEHQFLWRFHAVHHAIRNLSAANSYHHWTEPVWISLASFPLFFVDLQIAPTLAFLTFLFTFQQFFIHSSARPHFGPLRWLLVDNRYHRIHHSLDPEHHGRNFGAATPLWDWLFGTLYLPKSSEWPDVGLTGIEEPTSVAAWSWMPFR